MQYSKASDKKFDDSFGIYRTWLRRWLLSPFGKMPVEILIGTPPLFEMSMSMATKIGADAEAAPRCSLRELRLWRSVQIHLPGRYLSLHTLLMNAECVCQNVRCGESTSPSEAILNARKEERVKIMK